MNVEAGQCVLLHIVGHHADEVEAGDDLRAVPVAFVIDDERFQNFPRGEEVALAVKEQRIAEVRIIRTSVFSVSPASTSAKKVLRSGSGAFSSSSQRLSNSS